MSSLLNADDARAILQRIHRLRPDARAEWGKMEAAQMLAHCQIPLRLALGEQRMRRKLIGLLFGRLARRTLTGPKPFRRNLPTAPEFRVSGARDFAIERENLIALVQRLQAGGAAGITRAPHPFFGRLGVEQWEALLWKHLDHHLRQFGA